MLDASVLALLAVARREPVVPAPVVPGVLVVPELLPLEPQLQALLPPRPLRPPLSLRPHRALEALAAVPFLSRQSFSVAMAVS